MSIVDTAPILAGGRCRDRDCNIRGNLPMTIFTDQDRLFVWKVH